MANKFMSYFLNNHSIENSSKIGYSIKNSYLCCRIRCEKDKILTIISDIPPVESAESSIQFFFNICNAYVKECATVKLTYTCTVSVQVLFFINSEYEYYETISSDTEINLYSKLLNFSTVSSIKSRNCSDIHQKDETHYLDASGIANINDVCVSTVNAEEELYNYRLIDGFIDKDLISYQAIDVIFDNRFILGEIDIIELNSQFYIIGKPTYFNEIILDELHSLHKFTSIKELSIIKLFSRLNTLCKKFNIVCRTDYTDQDAEYSEKVVRITTIHVVDTEMSIIKHCHTTYITNTGELLLQGDADSLVLSVATIYIMKAVSHRLSCKETYFNIQVLADNYCTYSIHYSKIRRKCIIGLSPINLVFSSSLVDEPIWLGGKDIEILSKNIFSIVNYIPKSVEADLHTDKLTLHGKIISVLICRKTVVACSSDNTHIPITDKLLNTLRLYDVAL